MDNLFEEYDENEILDKMNMMSIKDVKKNELYMKEEKRVVIEKIKNRLPTSLVNDEWSLDELYQRLDAMEYGY